MLDFSNEDEQQERQYGPVPAGSIVAVRMTVLEPSLNKRDEKDALVSVASTGLRQLYVQCEVDKGQYSGVQWRQTITLPAGMQRIQMTSGQEKSAKIGGALLKAILVSAKKSTKLQSLKQFDGLRFAVKVKLQDKGYEADNGEIYWRNEIARAVTPDMPEYAELGQKGEIINPNGAIAGDPVKIRNKNSQSETGASFDYDAAFAENPNNTVDEVPF